MRRATTRSPAHHELRSEVRVVVSSDRTFGLVFSGFFTIVGAFPLLRSASPRWWALLVAAVFLVLALTAPRVLHPFNLMWARLAVILHYVVSPVAMALLFFLAFLPVGLLLRLFGKDVLRLRREPESSSYWIVRNPPGPPPASMTEQF